MSQADRAIEQVTALSMAGRHQAAVDMLRALARQRPKDPEVARWLACELANVGLFDQAIYHAERALMLKPGMPEASLSLAYLYHGRARIDDAIRLLDESAKHYPEHEEVRLTPLAFLSTVNRRQELLERTKRTLEEGFDNPEVWIFRGIAQHESGQVAEGMATLDEGARRHPKYLRLQYIRAFVAQYVDGLSARDLREIHLQAGRLVRELSPPALQAFDRDRSPDRTLRVGFMCADFRRHVSAFFLMPLLDGLRPEQITPMIYHASTNEDDFSERFKGILREKGGEWKMVEGLDDDALVAVIRRDRLDVLVECSGYINLTRVPALGLRAAPVQCSWMAYPTGTGIDTIDYRLTDAIVDPPGMPEGLGEAVLRLDGCMLSFDPIDEIPEPGPCPSQANGYITFGCFNAIKKVTPTTVRMWSELLKSVPGSKLRVRSRGMEEQAFRDHWQAKFTEAGIARERVDLLPPLDGAKHLIPDYRHVDIALDPFPYHGTTTTCEALAMGVPLLTRMGETPASRVGGTLLEAVGLGELVACTEEQFVRIGAGLAADASRRAMLRADLPGRVRERLGDSSGFAARFERAIRQGWRAWCAPSGSA